VRGDVSERHVVRKAAEKRNAFADEHRDAGDDEPLNEARAQKSLNGDAAVDVEVVSARGREAPDDFGGLAAHLFDDAADDDGKIDGTTAQHHDACFSIRPRTELENDVERVAADDNRVDAGHEFVVSVRLAAAGRQKIEIAIQSRNEAVDAGADEDGCSHADDLIYNRDVFVRAIDLNAGRDEVARCRALLSDDERARADRFRLDDQARRFIVARANLRAILGEVLARGPHEIEITLSPHGKPVVRGVEFNVSHSHERAVIVVAESPVGIDIEYVREKPVMPIAQRFFAPDEVDELRRADDPLRAFFRCWTAKEAYLKARGEGITLPLDWFAVSLDREAPSLRRATGDDPSRWKLARVDVGDDYVCTTCTAVP